MDDVGFNYDLAINAGDFDSAQTPPTADGNDKAGVRVVDALSASPFHKRAEHYCIAGNHDAGVGNMDWFSKYIDVLGENVKFSRNNPAERPFPITPMEDGAWHSYYISVGNIIIFMLSDRNEFPGPYGRGDVKQKVDAGHSGGYPSGTISKKTWDWFKDFVPKNTDKTIFVCSHQGVRNTVIATGDNEGDIFHGESGIPAGGGSVYTIYDEANPEASINGTDVIKDFFASTPNHTVRLWVNGHSHSRVHDVYKGRGIHHFEAGVNYLNVCSLTTSWLHPSYFMKRGLVDSRSWTCEVSGEDALLRCFVHRSCQPGIQRGFVKDLKLEVKLAHPFQPA